MISQEVIQRCRTSLHGADNKKIGYQLGPIVVVTNNSELQHILSNVAC
jgi:hypothetical protein